MKASLVIEVAKNGHKTVLKNSYATPPFKVANITEDKQNPMLHLMLMSASPGILEGDDYDLRIVLPENCALRLHTQSYQRLFTMQQGASQTMTVELAKNSTFIYVPHPVVPHEKSSFVAKNKIYLSEGCTLIWAEILTCGRQLNKEVFQFTKLHNHTEIYWNNKLIIKENLLMHPSVINPFSMGQMEGFTHQASFIFLKNNTNIKETIEQIHSYLIDCQQVDFGISELPLSGFVLRLLGYKAEQLYAILHNVAALLTSSFVENNTGSCS
ncbi:MAG: urease accessory protein UreD [Saprospiraceae bacterium]|nr:urease accessory protein UreD [Saprospiraceae bacterium]